MRIKTGRLGEETDAKEEEVMHQFLNVFCDVMGMQFSEHGLSRQNQVMIVTQFSENASASFSTSSYHFLIYNMRSIGLPYKFPIGHNLQGYNTL